MIGKWKLMGWGKWLIEADGKKIWKDMLSNENIWQLY